MEIEAAVMQLAMMRAVENVDPASRDHIAALLAESINQVVPRLEPNPEWSIAEAALRQDGIVSFGQVFSKEQCASIVDRVRQQPCYAAHVPAFSDGVAGTPAEIKRRSPYASYKLHNALEIPELLAFASDMKLHQLADAYLGCQPTIYSIHLFWTFGGLPKPAHTHLWHRDIDDYRFLSCFVYLTDVEEGEGQFQFLRKTHNVGMLGERLKKVNLERMHRGLMPVSAEDYFPPKPQMEADNLDHLEYLLGDEIMPIVGPAGSAFIGDTFGLHRGTVPQTRDRLVCWIRFGLTKNITYMRDRTQPRPAAELSYLTTSNAIPWAHRLILT